MRDEEGMKKTWTGETSEGRKEFEGSMASSATALAFADNRGPEDESLSLLGLILFDRGRQRSHGGDNAVCDYKMMSGMVTSNSRVIVGEMVSMTHAKTLEWRDVDSKEEYDLPVVKHLVEQGADVEPAVPGVTFDPWATSRSCCCTSASSVSSTPAFFRATPSRILVEYFVVLRSVPDGLDPH
uniref:Uncharacterized protein n=1 Tax=Phytophthora ramorum TaxID=164328 RepID=H3H8T8_PHYRM